MCKYIYLNYSINYVVFSDTIIPSLRLSTDAEKIKRLIEKSIKLKKVESIAQTPLNDYLMNDAHPPP